MRFQLKFLGGWRWLQEKCQPVSGEMGQGNARLECIQRLTISLGVVTGLLHMG
ncbi:MULTISPECIES: hypothetical protein [Cyanophyceae]|uniref:hypothetical protein n=1 Tax=Cyanophyceae TaxID=3028117 RepID=UPI001685B7BD|nr:hypothetical protein [Trichocoleus sp. FACHB-40]MBD2002345.1 hypothetical protein [Trichocoleus sp. FACHB-40]